MKKLLRLFYDNILKWSICVAITTFSVFGVSGSVNANSPGLENTDDSIEQSAAFQHTVSGTVYDARTGEPLPGVSILVQGTNMGTATNPDGEYSLDVPDAETVLVFSFIGYGTQQIDVGDQEVINVEMQEDLGRLDEVIVVGYGTVARRDLTGSVERIDADLFRDQSVTQVSEILSGSIAGFNAVQGTSASGGAQFEVRGPNSLTASTEPLIVLDGVIYRGSLSEINPADIESVDILKDASSSAVFGSRAASGVVLITTTRGEIGRPTVSFNTSVGRTQTTTNHYKWREAEDFLQFRQDFFRSQFQDRASYYWTHPSELPDGVSQEDWRGLADNPLTDFENEWIRRMNFFPLEADQYRAGETFNWGDYVYPTGTRSESTLSLSGGSDNAQYYWSIGYINNEGIIRGDHFSAVRTRLNVDFQVVDWLSAGINAQYSDRDESTIPANIGQTHQISPFSRFYDEQGNLEWFPHGYTVSQSPVINTLNAQRDRKFHNLFASLYAEVILPFGINHRVTFQPRYQTARDFQFWGPDTQTGGESVSGGRADRETVQLFEWMLTNMMTWDRDFGSHRFDVTLVHEVEENQEWDSFMQNITFQPSPALGYHGMQFGTNPSMSMVDTRTTGDALMARVNYTLLDRYLFTASIRRDGYSAFGQENPRAVFPAAAFAWQVSEESFFNVDMVNSLKLRLSYGVNGNREIGPYSSLAQLGSNMYYDGTSLQMGVQTSTLANRALRWEETESFNIGLDIGILESRIDLNIDYYDMTTTNLLVDRTLPKLTGFDAVTTNIGELGNKGFEVTLRTINAISENFNWRSTLNFSLNRNKINSLFGDIGSYTLLNQEFEGEIPSLENNWFPGRSIDVVWDYDILGMWQEEEAAEAAQYGLSPGDIKARDVSGSGNYVALEDKMFIGHSEPRYRIGFRNQVDFLKNFSANIFIRADLGHIRPFPDAIAGWSTFDRRSTPPVPYWTVENRSNDWPRLSKNVDPFGGGVMVYKDASFVRIQDFTLSYSVPVDIVERFQLRNVRIYGSVRNLYSFDDWDGWDPESGHSPMPRTFTFGLNLSI